MPVLDADRVIAALRGAFARDVGPGGAAPAGGARRSAPPARPTPRCTCTCCTATSWCSRPTPGRETEHTRIAVGQGVCGTAVATGEDQNVPDVRAIANYIACNTWTRSELVVLIRRGAHDPRPDRRGQRRARPVHARRGGGGAEGGGRAGRAALTRANSTHARLVVRPVHRSAARRPPVSHRQVRPDPRRGRRAGAAAAGAVEEPDRAERWALGLVHTPRYVDAVLDGTLTPAEVRRLGFPWSPQLRERSLRTVQGTLEAARDALDGGLGINLAGGTHHAFAGHGEGFCVFNDVAIAIRVLQREGRLTRVAVVDLDVHQGNGTAQHLRRRPGRLHLLDARRPQLPLPQGAERARRGAARRLRRRGLPGRARHATSGGAGRRAARAGVLPRRRRSVRATTGSAAWA